MLSRHPPTRKDVDTTTDTIMASAIFLRFCSFRKCSKYDQHKPSQNPLKKDL